MGELSCGLLLQSLLSVSMRQGCGGNRVGGFKPDCMKICIDSLGRIGAIRIDIAQRFPGLEVARSQMDAGPQLTGSKCAVPQRSARQDGEEFVAAQSLGMLSEKLL